MENVNVIDESAIVKVEFSGSFLMELKQLLFAKLDKYGNENSEEDVKMIFKNMKDSKKQKDLESFNIQMLFIIVSSIEKEMESNNLFKQKSIDDLKKEMESSLD